jgi:hypothetical protein
MAQDNRENMGFGVAAAELSGTVEKIISRGSSERQRVQIRVKRGDEAYGVIRIENILLGADDKPVALKKGANVYITITSNPDSRR